MEYFLYTSLIKKLSQASVSDHSDKMEETVKAILDAIFIGVFIYILIAIFPRIQAQRRL